MPRAGGPRDDTPETIADQQLMFKQERLSRDASRTTRAEQFPKVTSRWIARISRSRMTG